MKAETLKKSILQYAMQGKLVAQDPNDEPASELLKRIKVEKEQLIKDGKIKKEKPLPPITADEIPYELPQGWEWVRLGDICKLSQGNRVKNVQLPLLNAKYLRFKLEKIIYTEGILVNNGDYLILVDGENSGEVFYAFEDGIMGSTFKLLDISNYVSLNFVLKILQFYQDIFRGSKKGAAIPHLDKTLFKNVVIGLPPIAEQQRIVEKLEEILPLVEEYGKNEEILSEMNKKLPKQIRQSIFQYAVQGKLVPQNPNDEPASELLKRIKAEKEQLIKDGKIKKEKPLPPITPDEIPFEIPKSWTWVYWNDLLSYEQYSMKRGPFGSALKKDFFVPKGIRVFEQYNAINDGYSIEKLYRSQDIKFVIDNMDRLGSKWMKILEMMNNKINKEFWYYDTNLSRVSDKLGITIEQTTIFLKYFKVEGFTFNPNFNEVNIRHMSQNYIDESMKNFYL